MRRLGQRTLEFDRPTILSHGAVGLSLIHI